MTHEFKESDKAYLQLIYGDPHRYLQILLNFVSNAVKFTPEGGSITIQTVLKDKQAVKSQTTRLKGFSDNKIDRAISSAN